MKKSFSFVTIHGIEIGAHFSWLIIAAMAALSLASYFSQLHGEWPPGIYWVAAVITSLLFFSTIVAHELGHTLVAIHYGIPVKQITLFLFGGVSKLEQEPKSARQEILIALAGPMVSIVLGLTFMGVSGLVGINSFIGAITAFLGTINIGLAVFNLLPGFPLDGGRLLRGIIWLMTGNAQRATRIAAQAGQIMAMMLIITGIMIFIQNRDPGGIWLALISWFLYEAAREYEAVTESTNMLENVTVAHLMAREMPTVTADTNLSNFVDNYLKRNGQRYAMVIEDKTFVGLISISDLRVIEPVRWPQTTVAELMKPIDKLCYVKPDDPARLALEIMARENFKQLPVIDDGQVCGIISQSHFINHFSNRSELNKVAKLPQPQFN